MNQNQEQRFVTLQVEHIQMHSSLITCKLSAKAQATVTAISNLPAGQVIDFGTLAEQAGNGKAALATSNLRHSLYGCPGVEFVLPLHRISSKSDPYGRIDGATCVGTFGRVAKIAIREIERVFSTEPIGVNEKCPICQSKGGKDCSRIPSVHGLPAPKPQKTKKRKGEIAGSEEEANRKNQNAIFKCSVVMVDAAVVKQMVDEITDYITQHGVEVGDAYKHLPAILGNAEMAMGGTGTTGTGTGSQPAAKRRKTGRTK